MSKSQYCGYEHFSGMLERSGSDWLIGMWEVYFDDSGTDANSDIAIAACYISTKRGWDDFVKAWNDARVEEGFDVFHMAEFVAPPEHGHKPFCEWDKAKKDHVYQRLAKIVNENKRIGIACAVPKRAYDKIPASFRAYHGQEHYTFAIRMCLMRIGDWREGSLISLPMQYVFDWERENSNKRAEICNIFDTIHPGWEKWFGMESGGYSFQKRADFKPLQAADILAWQMRNHMRKIFPIGHDKEELSHPGFLILRQDQHMDLGFFTDDQIDKWVKMHTEYQELHGSMPFGI